jgi:hypothetical protein
MPNRRTGKIARLRKDLRDQVNTMLRDGAPYAQIIRYLAQNGADEINDQNLTNWKDGGYQDWLKEQERLADLQAKREFAFEIVKQNEGSKIHEASLQLAASQLYEVISDYDLTSLKELLADKPANYAKVVNALAKLSSSALDIEKYREQVKAQKDKISAEISKAKNAGLTPETLTKIEDALNLL